MLTDRTVHAIIARKEPFASDTVNVRSKFQATEHSMANRKPNQNRQNQQGNQRRPVGNYNPGNQAGKSVQGGPQRPANTPGGPFLGASTSTPPTGSAHPEQTRTPRGKGKQDAPQN